MRKIFLLLGFLLFNFFSPAFADIKLELKPAALSSTLLPASYLMGFQCPSCSPTNIKQFAIALRMSTASNCSSAASPSFPNTSINTNQPLYLDGAGLANYAQLVPLTGIKCVQFITTGGSKVTTLTTGISPAYTRTFPANPPILALS